MGINDDILAYAGSGLYEDDDDPMFSRLLSGETPRPIEEFYKGIDSYDEDRPEKHPPVELNPWEIMTTSKEWGSEHTQRLGEILGAHTKDVGRNMAIGALSTSEWLNRMKQKYVPYYTESTAVKALADTITKFGPGIMAMDENHEMALSMLAESEYLKADPRGLETHNWFEGLVSVGPQIGSMILASAVGGPWAGFGMIGMQILGGTYDGLIQEGTPPEDAYYWSLGNAVVQGALEMVPFLHAMNKFKLRMPMLEGLKSLGQVVGTEFLTEWAQAYPDSFINIFATNPDKDLWKRAELFKDSLWETTKQGMYEGTLTAPWSLLFAPFGAVAARKQRKTDRATKKEEDERYHRLRMEEDKLGKGPAMEAADEGDFVPFSDNDIISRRVPNRKASSVTQAHLDMMTPEQQQVFLKSNFRERFAEINAAMPDNPVEIENRQERALEAADEFAKTLRIVGNDVFTRQPNLDDIQKERILQDLGLVQTQDQYEGAMEQIGIIRGNGIPDRPAFSGIEPIGLTREEYDRRANLLGTLSDFYFVDRSQIPPDLRAAYSMMAEQLGSAEPKGVTFIDEAGNLNLAEGMAHGYGSSYPGWFKEPFTIRYRDSRIKKDKSGKTVIEPDKKIPVREMQEKKEEFKYGLNRKDFFDLTDKLDTGKLLTARQLAISDHIMGIAQAMKASDPELFLGGEIAQLESDGYEILGTAVQADSLELGDQAAIEGDGYSWDKYTVVSEDDGAGNMVLDSLTDRIQIPPSDELNVVGVKRNNYWQTMYDIGGPQGITDAPRTLPGIEDIEPLHQLTNVYSNAQMEEDFANKLPELAEFFENPDAIREGDDRRQTEVPVEEDNRSGLERRENWQMTADIDKMTPAERTEALEFTRKFATVDVLTGLLNRNALELHKEEFGADVPFVSIDVDGLKYYNDMTKEGMLPTGERVVGGHAMGDQALALMGQAMTEAAETTGITDRVKLYRMGGDEYGVSGIDRDSVSRDELETLRLAVKDSASQIIFDFLGKDDNIHYQLNGLAFTSATGGTVSNAISAAEKIKDGLPAEYATIVEEGKEKPTRARIPGTRVEVNYLPVGWSQKGEGLLASQARENEQVGRSLGQAKPVSIDEQVVDVGLTGVNPQWTPEDTVEDAVVWTMAQVHRLSKSPALPDTNAWNFILEELAYEAEDIGMSPSTLAFAVSSGALQQAQEYLPNEQLGVVPATEAGVAPVPLAVEAEIIPAVASKRGEAVKPVKLKVVPTPKKAPVRPQLPAPPPKLVTPDVVLAETLPSPEEAPTVKSRKAKFVRENMEFMPMDETATVRYMDPETGEMTETEEPAREAFSDMEENVNEFYSLMECLKT